MSIVNDFYFEYKDRVKDLDKLDEIRELFTVPYQSAILIQNIKDILEVKD